MLAASGIFCFGSTSVTSRRLSCCCGKWQRNKGIFYDIPYVEHVPTTDRISNQPNINTDQHDPKISITKLHQAPSRIDLSLAHRQI
jgi:hypothetical protein